MPGRLLWVPQLLRQSLSCEQGCSELKASSQFQLGTLFGLGLSHGLCTFHLAGV